MAGGRFGETGEPVSGAEGIFAEATDAELMGDGSSEAVRGAACVGTRWGDGGILKFSPRAACSSRSVRLNVRKPGWLGAISCGVAER